MAARRTSRRTSGRLRANERTFVQGISPLDYRPTGYPKGAVQRLAIVDTDAPAPPSNAPYFVERSHVATVSKTGKPLAKPRKVVTLPGAPPNTVAFLDYHVYGPRPGAYGAYINYMSTRRDMQQRGLARELLLYFMDNAERSGVTYVNFGKIMSPAIWKLYEQYKALFEGGASKIQVGGKRDF